MGKFNTEYFFARRLASGDGGRRNGVMTKIATLSVAVGLSVMIISLSVIFGFKKEITEKMTGFLSHVQIQHYESDTFVETVPISSEQPFLEELRRVPGFKHMNRYATKAGIIKGDDAIQGVVLKGVGGDYDWSFFEKNLVEGSLPAVRDSVRKRETLISKMLAAKMGLKVGDQMEMLFIQNPPRRYAFRISGIYNTDLEDIDNLIVMGDIRDVQRLNRWEPTQISGFELTTNDFDNLEQFTSDVTDVLLSMEDRIEDFVTVSNIRENNPVMFDWLDTHNLNALIIIIVMLSVAVFNMIAAILIILLEKTSMIGILKALGMQDHAIQRIFIARSSFIIIKGMLWGNAIGLLLCFIQKYTGLVSLTSEGYFLTSVPIYINWWWIIILNVAIFALILVLQVFPTMMISKILPEKSIRFE